MPNARTGFYADAARIAALYEMHDEMERWWRKAVAAGAGPDHAALTGVRALVEFAADPVLEVTDPSDGVVVRAASVTVRGELAKGRTTDEVLVNGNLVRKGPGAFTATVATGVGGPLTIEVSVEESGQRRGAAVRRTVHYDALPRVVQDFLSGWAAAYGVETDEATGYPKRIQRTKDSALMVLVPAVRSGATSESSGGGTAVENPRDPANSIGAFYLDETAVTVAKWRAFAESGGGTMPARLVGYGPQAPIPVARGSDEAKAYATWAQVVLPSDAQWAWAANGGWVAEGGGDHGPAARGAASSGGGDFTYRIDAVPTNVRQQPPNGYGLYGMGVRTSTSFRCASRNLPERADGHGDERP
jgi:formylglycine-generating enzyme required for sulfatase activity